MDELSMMLLFIRMGLFSLVMSSMTILTFSNMLPVSRVFPALMLRGKGVSRAL